MATRVGNAIVTAGVGAIATVVGLFVAKKVENYFSRKPKMKLFHKHMRLSTRCAWLIAELGAEADFVIREDTPPPLPPISSATSMELLMIRDAAERREGHHQGALSLWPVHDGDELPRSDRCPSPDSEYYNYELDYPNSDYDSPMAFPSRTSVPTLVVNDEYTMIEGASICLYLADLYGQFLPDLEHKAEYYSWIMYSAATFDRILMTLQKEMVDQPESTRDQLAVTSALNGFHAFLRALSETLVNREYLCGPRFTAADCVLGFTLWWSYTLDGGCLLDDHPVVLSYLDRLRARPAFRKTFGDRTDEWDWSEYFSTYVRGLRIEH